MLRYLQLRVNAKGQEKVQAQSAAALLTRNGPRGTEQNLTFVRSVIYRGFPCFISSWTVNAICVTFTLLCITFNVMPKIKTATLNLRIDPSVKEGIRIAADQEHRSVANMVEMLIRRHCDDSGIRIPQQSELFRGNNDE